MTESSKSDLERRWTWDAKAISWFFGGLVTLVLAECAGLYFYLHPSGSMSDRKDYIDAAGKVAGGTIILAGVAMTALTLRTAFLNIAAVEAGVDVNREAIEVNREALEVNREQIENNRLATEETARITREGQITERYTRAIDQLGSEHDEVRLGAIYALERIAKDSPPDLEMILDILCAYVRKNATATSETPIPNVLREDVSTILNVLGRRMVNPQEIPYRIQLSGTDLRQARFQRAPYDFRTADFILANFTGAALFTANLEGALMSEANLTDTVFLGETYSGSVFNRAIFTGATLGFAKHLGLPGLGEYNTIFRRAQFQDAKFVGTRFIRAAFYDGCGFQGADLTNAYFIMTDLSGVEGLTVAQLKTARMDEYTCAHLPVNLRPPGTFN